MRRRILAVILALFCLILSACENQEKVEESPLEQMKAYNQVTENTLDDKYRTYYEVFVYSYYDSNGDGIGDINGLIQKLDYIGTDLGCNGIWLMPIMPSGSYHKYDIKDYYSIDEDYGTMEDFDAFMDACNQRGIDVLLDLVINHTSYEHPWFVNACDSLRQAGENEENLSPYVDYYNFTKEKINATYYPVEGTDWYYEGCFSSRMPDLNLKNEQVRKEISDITKFWLEKGIAGFRLDAAKEYESDNTTANVEILSWLDDTVKKQSSDAYIVAEVWTDIHTYSKYYESGIDSVFNFAFASQEGIIASSLNHINGAGALSYGKAVQSLEERFSNYNSDFIDAPFYTNHDIARSAGYYSSDGSTEKTKLAMAMNLMMSGNAFIYYGEEIGMKGSGKDENKRAPMYWQEDSQAEGMCIGPPDMDSFEMKYSSLEEQQQDGSSIYNFIKEAVKLRNSYPAIARGSVQCLEELSDENVCVLKKTYKDEEILIVWNLSDSQQVVELGSYEISGSEGITGALLTGIETPSLEDTTLTLPAYSMVLI